MIVACSVELPPSCDVIHITLAHCDAIERGSPPHQFSVKILVAAGSGLGESQHRRIEAAIKVLEAESAGDTDR